MKRTNVKVPQTEEFAMKATGQLLMKFAEQRAAKWAGKEHRELCHTIYQVGSAIVDFVDRDLPFYVQVGVQQTLPTFDEFIEDALNKS